MEVTRPLCIQGCRNRALLDEAEHPARLLHLSRRQRSFVEGVAVAEKVVLVLEDGSRVKGVTTRFQPGIARTIRIRETDPAGSLVETHDIPAGSILAAFFVHDLARWRSHRKGSPRRVCESSSGNGDRRRLVVLTMLWNERLTGTIRPVSDDERWFELLPVDTERSSNIRRAVISRRAILEIESAESSLARRN